MNGETCCLDDPLSSARTAVPETPYSQPSQLALVPRPPRDRRLECHLALRTVLLHESIELDEFSARPGPAPAGALLLSRRRIGAVILSR